MADRGVETLLPLRKRTSQWKTRTKLIEAALFPAYCFARFNFTQRQWVLQTPGVLEILANENELEPVIAEELAAMQRLVQTSISYEAHPYPAEGATVEVLRGPLVGTRGKSLRRGGQSRFVIPLTLIRRAVAVEIEPHEVRAFPADTL